jgi:RimJ/RimL family protein N-acetyltransferase
VSDIALLTDRLILTPLRATHARVHPEGECAAAEAHWAANGFGTWAVLDRATESFVGAAEVHFAYPGVEGISTDEVEVGWSIAPGRRGAGLATEAMRAAIDDAWGRARASHVVAYIRPGNGASARVAEKLGFVRRGPGRARSGEPVDVYEKRRVAAVRELWDGRVWLARAWTVLEDGPERLVLADAPGAETRVPVDAAGSRLRVPGREWRLAESTWENWTIRVTRPGEPWSTLVFLDSCGEHLSWYVNFERPFARSRSGWDTLDWKLDLLVFPDGRSVLKDEDELQAADEAGIVDGAEVLAALARVRAQPSWPTGFEQVEVDPAWGAARLPPGWDAVEPAEPGERPGTAAALRGPRPVPGTGTRA